MITFEGQYFLDPLILFNGFSAWFRRTKQSGQTQLREVVNLLNRDDIKRQFHYQKENSPVQTADHLRELKVTLAKQSAKK